MYYVPFEYQASLFSLLNAAGSLGVWWATRRRTMVLTGAFNTALGATAVYMYKYDAAFANVCVSVAALCACGQFTLHGFRTKALRRPTLLAGIYYGLCFSLLCYGVERGKWAYALRND